MKLVLGFVGIIGALAAVFIGMPTVLINSTGFSGGGYSNALPVPEIAAMVSEFNAKRATNLTTTQRQKANDLCMATFKTQRKPGMVDEENTAKLIKDLEGEAKEKCGCMIRSIAGQTNMLGFAMSMSMRFVVAEELDINRISIGQDLSFSAFDDLGQQVGVGENDMKTIRVSALNAVVEASQKCR